MVDVSRALGTIPGEFGALLGQIILENRIDGDPLLDWLNSLEAKAEEEPLVTGAFCKHSNFFLLFLDQESWNRLCSANSQIYLQSVSNSTLATETPSGRHASGLWLACGSDDGVVRLWNGRNGRCTLLEGLAEHVSCVFFFSQRENSNTWEPRPVNPFAEA